MQAAERQTQQNYRIGLIVPSSNTTMETEIPAMLRAREALHPERFTFHSSRMRMHKVTPEELANMNKEGLRCAAELADARSSSFVAANFNRDCRLALPVKASLLR